jgi:autotransporter adhesin
LAAGVGSNASGANSMAVGNSAQATGSGSQAFGQAAFASGDNSVAQGNGASASGAGSVAQGVGASASGVSAVAQGGGASAAGDYGVASGFGANAAGDYSTALGYSAHANALNSVAIGAGSVASAPNTFSVGSVGNERRITNVAPGIDGTDAVNMDQYNWLSSEVGDNHDTAMAGIAISNAMATVLPREGKHFAMRVGGGFYGGSEAIGITAAGRVNNNISIDAGFGASTSTQSEYGGKIGVTYEW